MQPLGFRYCYSRLLPTGKPDQPTSVEIDGATGDRRFLSFLAVKIYKVEHHDAQGKLLSIQPGEDFAEVQMTYSQPHLTTRDEPPLLFAWEK